MPSRGFILFTQEHFEVSCMDMEVINYFITQTNNLLLPFVQATAPLWSMLLFGYIGVTVWMTYIRTKKIQDTGSVLLEIKLPKEVLKSPRAMELVLVALYQKGNANLIETYWDGKFIPWYSLELVSIGGEVHFFIWTQPKMREIIETQIYAQFPTVEIFEVDDYTKDVKHNNDSRGMWGTYFKLTKADPFPIKTYVDYGLDTDPKEEFKIDPMATVVEYLGSLKKGEQAWIQILIQAHKKQEFKDGRLFTKDDWGKEGKMEIDKIRAEATPPKVAGNDFPGFPNPTKGQVEQIAAIERSLDKFAFETGIRAFYIAENDSFNEVNIPGLIGCFKQYSSNTMLNGFKLGWFTDFDYPWQDFRRMRRNRDERMMLDAYKRRSFFYSPYKHFHSKPFILTTEELATIFHFPGSTVATPTFKRVLSKKVEAPSNLPT